MRLLQSCTLFAFDSIFHDIYGGIVIITCDPNLNMIGSVTLRDSNFTSISGMQGSVEYARSPSNTTIERSRFNNISATKRGAIFYTEEFTRLSFGNDSEFGNFSDGCPVSNPQNWYASKPTHIDCIVVDYTALNDEFSVSVRLLDEFQNMVCIHEIGKFAELWLRRLSTNLTTSLKRDQLMNGETNLHAMIQPVYANEDYEFIVVYGGFSKSQIFHTPNKCKKDFVLKVCFFFFEVFTGFFFHELFHGFFFVDARRFLL